MSTTSAAGEARIVAERLTYAPADGRTRADHRLCAQDRDPRDIAAGVPPATDAKLAVLLSIDERLNALRRLEAGNADVADLDVIADEWDLPERAAATLRASGLRTCRWTGRPAR